MEPIRRSILFDLDGTLTDNQVGIFRCIHYALKKLNIPLEESADLRWCVGPPLHLSLTQLAGGNQDLGNQALVLYRKRYTEIGLYENRLYDGILESLKFLYPHFALYVATSKPSVFAHKILRHFNIDSYFKSIYGSELNGTLADKGELIGHILKQEKLTDPVMVGDREHDVFGAKKNNIESIGVTWGFGSEEELRCAGAKIILHHPVELFPAIKTL